MVIGAVALKHVVNTGLFDQNIGNWDVSSVTTMEDMFENRTLSTSNYDPLLAQWSAEDLQDGVSFDGGNSQNSASTQAARDILTETYGWDISDGGAAL